MSEVLNYDSWVSIASYLGVKDLLSFSLLGKYFHSVSCNQYLWKKLICEDFVLPTSPSLASYKEIYIHQVKKEKLLNARANVFNSRQAFDKIEENEHNSYTFNLSISYKNIKRGDVVYLSTMRRLIVIYNGETFSEIKDIKDIGDVFPPGFEIIKEFPIRYWENVTVRVNFNPSEFLSQMIKNTRVIISTYGNQEYQSFTLENEIVCPSESRKYIRMFIVTSFTYDNYEYFIVIIFIMFPWGKIIRNTNLEKIYNNDYFIGTRYEQLGVPKEYVWDDRTLYAHSPLNDILHG